ANAYDLFQTAAQAAPQNYTYVINMADAKNLAGEREFSARIYNDLVEKINAVPLSAQDLRYRSQAYAHLGDIPAALTDLQALEKIDAQNIETIYTAALVHTLAGNKASAILNVERSVKNGLNAIWFSFDWFNSLCSEPQFLALVGDGNGTARCQSVNQ